VRRRYFLRRARRFVPRLTLAMTLSPARRLLPLHGHAYGTQFPREYRAETAHQTHERTSSVSTAC
jgi:hypothetical protein